MSTRKLCHKCAKDTAVHGRCPRVEAINKPGTICDRCLSDGRLLVSYNVCCEPESRFGHTPECAKARRGSKTTDPTLLRFASALFCTDPRVLTLVGSAFGEGLWDGEGTCLVLAKKTRIERLGRAWDLATAGHEPEATYRKEAEERAFLARQIDRELTEYGIETKRLTRESAMKKAAEERAGRPLNANPPPLPLAEHQANVSKYKAEEAEQNRLYSLRELQRREAEDERKRVERANRKVNHPECGRKPPVVGRNNPAGSPFNEERCTRQEHSWGDCQFVVRGRVLSAWNAETYCIASALGGEMLEIVGDTPALRSQLSDPPKRLGMDHPQAQVITRDQPPAGDLNVYDLPGTGRCIGGIDKNAMVSVLTYYNATWALVEWSGSEKRPGIKGYVLRQYLGEQVRRGGRLTEDGGLVAGTKKDSLGYPSTYLNTPPERNARIDEMKRAGLLPPYYPMTEAELEAISKGLR